MMTTTMITMMMPLENSIIYSVEQNRLVQQRVYVKIRDKKLFTILASFRFFVLS